MEAYSGSRAALGFSAMEANMHIESLTFTRKMRSKSIRRVLQRSDVRTPALFTEVNGPVPRVHRIEKSTFSGVTSHKSADAFPPSAVFFGNSVAKNR